ncbi:helix-turn-helix domain-containing protein [Amycolatopsis sp. ATCC 39116]|uniref:winged helix-turn-helix transcriptional regulator n=1 Tax=Amycolatopsis sp. (strain ATCC 39116 / 75iv2) TaxID=385957 RepID=UPI00026270F4|nr:helix-turn-helix domain-containing protein [Amycolatopsis sp. ATCC 39116]
MPAVMEGPLADLSSWKTDHCSLVKALEIVGTKSALLILREAFYGTTRFTAFAERIGITETAAARQLRNLTEAGLLDKQPYRDAGGRTRDEYVLTEMGRDLLPVVIGLMQWADKHLQDGGPPLLYVDHETGAPVKAGLHTDDGQPVELEELGVRLNPAWRRPRSDS